MPQLLQAQTQDAHIITSLLKEMSEETGEFGDLELSTLEGIIHKAIEEKTNGTTWFFFKEGDCNFGCCYLQNVHIYWRPEKCFYLGGFYIQPEFRGKGLFRKVNELLNAWMDDNETGEVFIDIHKGNEKSAQAFLSVGYQKVSYDVYMRGWEGDYEL